MSPLHRDNSNIAESSSPDYKNQYATRLADLLSLAPDEGLEFDEGSAAQFISFMERAPMNIRRAGIGLGADGEINAVWVSQDKKCRLSIEFYKDGDIKYAWLTEDGSIEIDRVVPQVFWSKFGSKLSQFLA